MQIPGRIRNGVVVLDGDARLPEGARVTVSPEDGRIWHKPGKKRRVHFPLVPSDRPGTLDLTNERIAEILADEDVTSMRGCVRRGKS